MDDVKLKNCHTAEHRYFSGVRNEIDENGEQRVSAPADTHYVRSYEQDKAYKQQRYRQEGRKQKFTFTNMENIQEVIDKVSDKHCGYLLFLQCFVSYNTIIRNPDSTYMTKSDMMKTLGLKRTAFAEFLVAMVANEIIFVDDNKYKLNPRYHFQGKTKNVRVVKSFSAKVKQLYGDVSAKDLGFIYKLLPFVHWETNTICANPYELDVEKTIPLNKTEIAHLTGVDERSVYNKLRNLHLGDEYVFGEMIVGNQHFYKLNPFIFYRKTGLPDASLREMFSLKRNFRKRT